MWCATNDAEPRERGASYHGASCHQREEQDPKHSGLGESFAPKMGHCRHPHPGNNKEYPDRYEQYPRSWTNSMSAVVVVHFTPNVEGKGRCAAHFRAASSDRRERP
jgi:hypothetical protein